MFVDNTLKVFFFLFFFFFVFVFQKFNYNGSLNDFVSVYSM